MEPFRLEYLWKKLILQMKAFMINFLSSYHQTVNVFCLNDKCIFINLGLMVFLCYLRSLPWITNEKEKAKIENRSYSNIYRRG